MKEMRNEEKKVVMSVSVPFGVNEDGESLAVELSTCGNSTIIVHGGSGSGKTTMLKYMMGGVGALYGGDVHICLIDAAATRDYKDFMKSFKRFNYCSVNPAVAKSAALIEYVTAMAVYRGKSIDAFDMDDVEDWNNVSSEKFGPVVVFVDEYQRFFGTEMEKGFAEMVNTISSAGAEVNMYLVLSSQSSKGTKVSLNAGVFTNVEATMCLRTDEFTSLNTIDSKIAGSITESGVGYYVTEKSKEPVRFYCDFKTFPKDLLFINRLNKEEKEAYAAKANELMKELFVDALKQDSNW